MSMPALKSEKTNTEARRQAVLREWEAFKNHVRDNYPIDQAITDFSNVSFTKTSVANEVVACCPFHGEKTPSFSVRKNEGTYICFGSGCGARGDIFTFIQEMNNISFKEAVLLAAKQIGVEPPKGVGTSKYAKVSKTKVPVRPAEPEMANPAGFDPCDLQVIPESVRRPKPNQWFPVWHVSSPRHPEEKRKPYKPAMIHEYRNTDGQLIMLIMRLEFPDRKIFIPIRLGDIPAEAPRDLVDLPETAQGLVDTGTENHRKKPIYGIQRTRDWVKRGGNKILIVEGEKTCDASDRLVRTMDDADSWLVVSPMGGSGVGLRADWSGFMTELSLSGADEIDVYVWPDADKDKKLANGRIATPQKKFSKTCIGGFLVAARQFGMDLDMFSFKRVSPGDDLEEGWDLADAEAEGWTGHDLQEALLNNAFDEAPDKVFLDMKIDFSLEEEGGLTPFEDSADDIGDMDMSDPGRIEELEEPLDEGEDLLAEIEAMANPQAADQPTVGNDGIEDAIVVSEVAGESTDAGHDREITAEEVVDADDFTIQAENPIVLDHTNGDTLQGHLERQELISQSPHFRCIGHRENSYYFMSLNAGRIYRIGYLSMKKTSLLSLAPLYYWSTLFAKMDARGNMATDWDLAVSTLIQQCLKAGYWDPRREAGQGARIDFDRVVFNTGKQVWVEGQGVYKIGDFTDSEYFYTVDDPCQMPQWDMAFTPEDDDPMKLLNIIKNIDWRTGHENLSTLGLFGWMCISPICGVLPWRPHLYLDGQRSAGKSWIIKNIVSTVLGDYSIKVKSNSTESGLRNMLHAKAFPLIFDEAEAEEDMDKRRLKSIMGLARHSASPDNSVVAQGVAGGDGQRYFSIASTFLLASITPQIDNSADKTRFARARLGTGHDALQFARKLERPAAELLTPEFSQRFIARIIMRAGDMDYVSKIMVQALLRLKLERRLADVFGTFAAGAWLLLKDGRPEDEIEAIAWIQETFNINDELSEFASEIEQDKDHTRLFRRIMATEIRCETLQMGTRTYRVGELMQISSHPAVEGNEEIINQADAIKRLRNIGICPGIGGKPLKAGQTADCMLIHKNSDPLGDFLSNTPYRTSYADVMQQAENVKNGSAVRFGGLGLSRSVIVPIEHFDLGPSEDEDVEEGTDGSG